MAADNKFLLDNGVTNIINYLRKSRQDVEREKKTGEDTLKEQQTLMDRVLADYGIPYDQKPEIGSGDKISTRPVFRNIIEELRLGTYQAIAVKEISRMGRGSYTDMGIIYDLIIEKTIYIITPWKIYDPTNNTDLRQIRFELFLSREEYETTRERLNGGRYNAALEGKWIFGPPPFGYDVNPKTQKLVINEKEAEIVRLVFDYYANGIITNTGKRKLVQFRALGTYLKRVGIKTITGKDEWSATFLNTFLSNERYIGTLRSNTRKSLPDGTRVPTEESEHIVVEDAHPPIIDPVTWETTQNRINNRDTHTNTKMDFEPSRLAGLCVCKKCGRKFVKRGNERTYTKKNGEVSRYDNEFLFCGTTGCTYIKYQQIENGILESLKVLKKLDPETLKAHLEYIVVDDGSPLESKEDVAKRIKSRKEEINRRMKFIQEKHESGIYTDSMFLERREELEKELEDLYKIDIEEETEENTEVDADLFKSKIDSVLSEYRESRNSADKNKLLHTIFSHVEIDVIKKGRAHRPAKINLETYLKSDAIPYTF